MAWEEINQDILLNIDQVSKLTGVRKSTLRYWEKSFDEYLKPTRTETNRREYTMADVEKIKAIRRLIEEDHLTVLGVRLRLGQLFSKNNNGN